MVISITGVVVFVRYTCINYVVVGLYSLVVVILIVAISIIIMESLF